jgi:hypothetical protein
VASLTALEDCPSLFAQDYADQLNALRELVVDMRHAVDWIKNVTFEKN